MKSHRVVVAVFVLAFLVAIPLMAQQAEETVTVKKSDLTADQLKKVEAQQITEQIGQYKEWAEMGKGVGFAVRESLYAVKDVTVDLSKTDVGKFTMFLVAWKVMFKDVLDVSGKIVGYLVGIPLLAIGLSVIVWSHRRLCVPHPVLKEKGPGLWVWRSKKYEMYDPNNESGGDMKQSDWMFVHVIAAVVLIIICCLIIFG